MIRHFRRWIMKVARKLHTIDKHTNGTVSTFIAAVVLAFLLVSVFITNELSQKKIQNVSQAQVATSPDEAACNASCAGQTINGSQMGGGTCLGLCMIPQSEIRNPQFPTCQFSTGAGQCCCYPAATPTPANTCNADCVAATYTSGSCQNATVLGGGLCSTGGTTINGNGGCGTQTCCCIFTGATATPTPTTGFPATCGCPAAAPFQCAQIGTTTVNCLNTPPASGWNCRDCRVTPTATPTPTTTFPATCGCPAANPFQCVQIGTGTTSCWNAAQTGWNCRNCTTLPTATPTTAPIATPATACGQSCYRNGGGDDGYCSSTATTCPNGGNRDQTFDCMTNRNACCCVYFTPTPTATTGPTATATTVPPTATATVTTAPTATAAPCNITTDCGLAIAYTCINKLCVTNTPTPTATSAPTLPATPTCFNPTPPVWSPGVTRSGDTITVAWNNQMDGLKSKVEVCVNGGGTCQVIFDGTSPASNSVQKTIIGISTKDIIVQMTSTNTQCGSTSDLASQYLSANASVGVNVAPTIVYSNGTPAWLIAGAAFIVVLLITVAIVAM